MPPSRPGRLSTALTSAGVAIAVVLSASALVVALTARSGGEDPGAAAPSGGSTIAATDPAATEAADRAFCTDIGPLMREHNKVSRAWFSQGEPGSDARNAGLPEFIDHTERWVASAENVVEQHPGVQPRLKRTTQRYLDDMWLFVNNIVPGPSEDYDKAAWVDGMVAYGGPQSICDALGAGW